VGVLVSSSIVFLFRKATRSGPSASFLNPVDSPVCRGRLISLAIAG
jgi:hypothetical protein